MNHNVNTMFGEEKRNMVLIGVLIVIIGFIVRINPLLVVTAAGLATGLLAHQSLYDIIEQFGTAFTTNRYMAVFIATLPVIGLLERFGLREQAESVVAKIKAATTGRILTVYLKISSSKRDGDAMKKVLVTGFDPFGGETVNPSLEAVKQAAGWKTDRYIVEVREIPTVFGKSLVILHDAIMQVDPDVVICVGQAGGRADISVERVAVNINDARIPDNEGQQPIDEPVVPGGPVGYWSTLPVKAIVEALRRHGIPASVSYTAGTFVCNHVFYGLMHYITQSKKPIRGGFIHIPYLPEQAARHPGQPSMALETIVEGLRLAIDVAIEREEDIQAVGGQIC
ncbi:Pyrrolidone-carboxylate peptidase [[Flavobacterium] thermophilum]|nr:Pyrrolidone-carboxylate peptidase [Geobacillus sp. 12AMOR1]STO12217.1 Pyrrolidone-carboxylate peptidase [[Flavobacterium] thermophilum]